MFLSHYFLGNMCSENPTNIIPYYLILKFNDRCLPELFHYV